MTDTTFQNFMTLIQGQIEHVEKHYLKLEHELGRVGAKEKLERGILTSSEIMDIAIDIGEPAAIEDQLIYACWPLACLWLDLLSDGRQIIHKGGDEWQIT